MQSARIAGDQLFQGFPFSGEGEKLSTHSALSGLGELRFPVGVLAVLLGSECEIILSG
jgi:hypothetical protein